MQYVANKCIEWMTSSQLAILTTLLSRSSGTFLESLQSAWAAVCEKMTGALVSSSVARIVDRDAELRSTIMPSRFISDTTDWRGHSMFPFVFNE